MPKLVDVDKVAEAIDWLNEYDFILWNEIMKCIDKVPEVDAVEVIRCKDCKYYYVYDRHNFCDLDIEMIRDFDPNYYCASAERKEDVDK